MTDKARGEWNAFDITMKGDRLTVVAQRRASHQNADLPGFPETWTHCPPAPRRQKDGKTNSPPTLVQFRNIGIKEQ